MTVVSLLAARSGFRHAVGMTVGTDEPTTDRRTSKGRKAVWLAIAVAVGWLLVGGAVGPLSGKLNEVQTNDNASFLPASAESTLVADEVAGFNEQQSFPGLVVITRPDGAALTPDDLAAAAAFAEQIPGLPAGDATLDAYLDSGPDHPGALAGRDGCAHRGSGQRRSGAGAGRGGPGHQRRNRGPARGRGSTSPGSR